MHILLAHQSRVPVFAYGGVERVIWDLARGLVERGHRVTFLVAAGSTCDFAEVIHIRPGLSWNAQVPADVDLAHFHFNPEEDLDVPYLVTEHGNTPGSPPFPLNTVFLSRDHAARHGSDQYVYNGVDWSRYAAVDWSMPRTHCHFLGKGEWRLKNLRGACRVAELAGVPIEVLGGRRLNFRRGFRFTMYPGAHFHGMVGGQKKFDLLNGSNGLIFPVRWNEPFGMAVIESLYFGAPVFATPYGSLPELVPEACGVLSANAEELSEAIRSRTFDPKACHAHAVRVFGADPMVEGYLEKYAQVMAGRTLNRAPPFLIDTDRRLPWRNGR